MAPKRKTSAETTTKPEDQTAQKSSSDSKTSTESPVSSDPHKDGTISNTTSTTSAVLQDLYKHNKDLDELDPALTNSDVDTCKPTDGQELTVKEKLERFGKFTTAMRSPDNAGTVRPFLVASLALLVLPLLVFQIMLKIVVPISVFGSERFSFGIGDRIPADLEIVLGMDKVTISGICAMLVAWMVMSTYVLYAWLDNPPRKQDVFAEVQQVKKNE